LLLSKELKFNPLLFCILGTVGKLSVFEKKLLFICPFNWELKLFPFKIPPSVPLFIPEIVVNPWGSEFERPFEISPDIAPENPLLIPPESPFETPPDIPPESPLLIPPESPFIIPPESPFENPPKNPLERPPKNPFCWKPNWGRLGKG
jgi:hypothetical protein